MATTGPRPIHGHRQEPSDISRGSRRGNPPGGGGYGGGNGSGSGRGRGRRPRRRKRNPFVTALIYLINTLVFLVLCVAAVGIAVVLSTLKSMPATITQIENYRPAGQTLIYSSDGVLLAKIFEQNRQTVTIDKIPTQLQDATVAIEDSRFAIRRRVPAASTIPSW